MDTTETTKPAEAKPPRRLRKWRLILAVLLALLALPAAFLAWAFVRGTWADRTPRNPRTSAEGTVVQLYQTADGRKQVRAAAVLDAPLEEVWEVVTDYEHAPEIFPYVKSARATPEADGRHHRLTGVVSGWAGEWSFETRVRHDAYLDDCVALWDQPGGDLTVNRGSCTLLRVGPATLLIYLLDVEAPPYPAFVVRNALLSGLERVVAAVGERLRAKRGR